MVSRLEQDTLELLWPQVWGGWNLAAGAAAEGFERRHYLTDDDADASVDILLVSLLTSVEALGAAGIALELVGGAGVLEVVLTLAAGVGEVTGAGWRGDVRQGGVYGSGIVASTPTTDCVADEDFGAERGVELPLAPGTGVLVGGEEDGVHGFAQETLTGARMLVLLHLEGSGHVCAIFALNRVDVAERTTVAELLLVDHDVEDTGLVRLERSEDVHVDHDSLSSIVLITIVRTGDDFDVVVGGDGNPRRDFAFGLELGCFSVGRPVGHGDGELHARHVEKRQIGIVGHFDVWMRIAHGNLQKIRPFQAFGWCGFHRDSKEHYRPL